MDGSKPASLSPQEEEDVINGLVSLSASLNCFHEAERVIEEKFSLNPAAAHSILESLVQQNRVEARSVATTGTDQTLAGYQWVQAVERNW